MRDYDIVHHRGASWLAVLIAVAIAVGVGYCIGRDSVQRERCVVTYSGGKP